MHVVSCACRLVEDVSAPVQPCPEQVSCKDKMYELPTSKSSSPALGVSRYWSLVFVMDGGHIWATFIRTYTHNAHMRVYAHTYTQTQLTHRHTHMHAYTHAHNAHTHRHAMLNSLPLLCPSLRTPPSTS